MKLLGGSSQPVLSSEGGLLCQGCLSWLCAVGGGGRRLSEESADVFKHG